MKNLFKIWGVDRCSTPLPSKIQGGLRPPPPIYPPPCLAPLVWGGGGFYGACFRLGIITTISTAAMQPTVTL